ncbi:MAG: Gfo/Idh/MocA family oxidoreductase [Verrucomicrobia bacterium]|nr:Gfo/Idh/MocA family oxidoreductase [Verrucomicrobiota bacterium]
MPEANPKTVNVGIIGGGLMGREVASAFARWCALTDAPVTPQLTAVADLNPDTLKWFERIPSAKLLTADYKELLASSDVDVVYVAVPHNLHEQLYIDTLEAGKDLLAEKPFGLNLAAAEKIVASVDSTGQFCRCSSEFPFFPGAARAFQIAQDTSRFGRILEVRAGFLHSSDLDPDKAANWKRMSNTCGEIGVMGDLGMHVAHLPLRLGWTPSRVYAQLQKGYAERRGVACDTWDNATLQLWVEPSGSEPFRMQWEMKRLAPGETDTWFFEVLGTDGGVRYSTKEPKTLWTFRRDAAGQFWDRTDMGFQTPYPTITGGIFEPGFPDVIQQMWCAFLSEREGLASDKFTCVTPREALMSHRVFDAALRSQESHSAISI